ncbi:MAG: hypothetical protein HY896_05005 [Deltaproteobacteria bacterium]|nr:hypothetical protein [Deltaproteobacteria bacterium]
MGSANRRKYLIDIRTQGPFLLKAGSICAAGTLLLCVLLYYLADEEIARNFYSVHLRIRNTWQILLPAVLISGGISFFLTIAAILYLALRESHRLGGPIYKFNILFARLESGNFAADFHFRRGDLLYAMGESYRAALQANRDRIAAVQELADSADSLAHDLRSKFLLIPLPPEERSVLDKTAETILRLREASLAFDKGTA